MNGAIDSSKWSTITYGFFDDQGFPHYEGTFWYRNVFDVPPVPAGKRLYLRVGAIDDDGKFFINGKLTHVRPHLDTMDWTRSFEFDVTDFVKPGEKNSIANPTMVSRITHGSRKP